MLIELISKGIEDYGFRQVLLWSPDDLTSLYNLSNVEINLLKESIHAELLKLPNPVEPEQREEYIQFFRDLIN
jgi:hypothetical protein